jgi:hypothetical protein
VGNIYPRVMIVSPDAMGSPNGTGVMLSSLFVGWPPDRLANLYYCGSPPPVDQCGSAWQLHPHNLCGRMCSRLERELFRTAGNDTVPGLTNENGTGAGRGTLSLGLMFRALSDLSNGRLPKAALDWARAFKPDLIYSLLWSLKGLAATESLALSTGVRVVPHFMDDWPTTAYREALGSLVWRSMMRRRLRTVLRRAPLGLAICADMAAEFSSRYGLPFEPFMRCVEKGEVQARQARNPSEAVRLIYTGGFHLGRTATLTLVANAAGHLRAAGISAVLTLHSPRAADRNTFEKYFARLPAAQWGGSLSPEEATKALSRADIGIHAESFDPRAVAYTRYSMSTKFPSYCAAGLPILAVGPEEISSVRYINSHGLGMVVGREDVSEIADCLGRLADNKVASGIGSRAQRHFMDEFEATRVRVRFLECLQRASAGIISASVRLVGHGLELPAALSGNVGSENCTS